MTARVDGIGRDEPVTVWDHPPMLVFYPLPGLILNPRQDDVCRVWTGAGMRGWWLDPDGVGFGMQRQRRT